MAGKKTGAKIDRVCILHELLVEMFIKDLRDAIECDYPLSSADKNVIVTFLKNEGVTATPNAEGMEKLKEDLKDLSEAQRAKVDALVTQVESGQFDDLLGPMQ